MITPCPHCQAEIEIDANTLAALQGHAHFQCPGCASLVPVPRAPVKVSADAAIRTVKASGTSGAQAISTPRGLNRNLIILGSVALLVLGGIGVYLASKKSGVAERQPLPDIFLGDLPPLSTQVNFGYRVNEYFDQTAHRSNLLQIDGKDCDRYLLTHTPSIVEFAIPEGYTQFKATGFAPFDPLKNRPLPGDWIYLIEVDGSIVFASKELRTYPNHQVPISVEFPNDAKKLTLRTISSGGDAYGHSLWGYPTLIP